MSQPVASARMDTLTARTVLQRNELFRRLPAAALDRVAELAARRSFDSGTVIFRQGDTGDALYGVVSGRVRISTSAAGGREVFLNIMEPGDTFGEIAVMDGLSRTAAATALEKTTLLVIRRSDFLLLLEREPRLAIRLLELLCERLRWTSELVEESAFLSGEPRLAKRLLILASQHGRILDSGSLELNISQSDLAHFLGISRQVVNQYLRDWQQRAWVQLGRSRIVIHDPDALRSRANQFENPD